MPVWIHYIMDVMRTYGYAESCKLHNKRASKTIARKLSSIIYLPTS